MDLNATAPTTAIKVQGFNVLIGLTKDLLVVKVVLLLAHVEKQMNGRIKLTISFAMDYMEIHALVIHNVILSWD